MGAKLRKSNWQLKTGNRQRRTRNAMIIFNQTAPIAYCLLPIAY